MGNPEIIHCEMQRHLLKLLINKRQSTKGYEKSQAINTEMILKIQELQESRHSMKISICKQHVKKRQVVQKRIHLQRR